MGKNNIALASFVKTPGTSPVKTRLAKTVGKIKAEDIFTHCVKSLEETFLSITGIDFYWALAEQDNVNHPLWIKLKTFVTGKEHLGTLLNYTYKSLREDYDYVFMTGSDSPQLSKEIIKEAIIELKKGNFVFGPTHENDGGFYLFAGSKAVSEDIWLNVAYSEQTTLKNLASHLEKIAPISYLPKLSDIDVKEDLVIVLEEFPSTPNKAQKELIQVIKDLI